MRPTLLLPLSLLLTGPAQAAALAGKVLLPNGKPAPGARVWVAYAQQSGPGGGGSVAYLDGKTDPKGAYKLVLKKGATPVSLGASGAGAAPAWKILPNGLPAGPVTLKLSAPVTLSGRLITLETKPAVGLRVGVGVAQGSRFPAPIVHPSVQQSWLGRSGPDGRFQISNLPPDIDLQLALPEEWLVTEATPPSFRTGKPGARNLGTLALLRAASVRLLAVFPDGHPIPGAPVQWRRVPAPGSAAAGPFPGRLRMEDGPYPLEIEVNGLGQMERIYPGRYEFSLHGKVTTVDVPEGGKEEAVRLVSRGGMLRGRVTDPDGKPVAGARVIAEVGKPRLPWPPGPEHPTDTDPSGAFSFPDFPREADQVVLRAIAGNTMGEWVGDPKTLGDSVTLKLKGGLLSTLRGRVLDPDGKPVPSAQLAVFTRTDGRPQALVVGQTGPDGKFEVKGVRKDLQFAVGVLVGNRPYESEPRQAQADADATDLGDLRVRPSTENQPTAEDLTAGFSPLAIAPTVDLAKAWSDAKAYLAALQRGDVAAVMALTSPLSPGYSKDPAAFLRSHALVLPPNVGAADLRPVPVLPRIAVLFLLGADSSRAVMNAALPLLDRPDWATVGYRGANGVDLFVILHREADGWKVMGSVPPGSTDFRAAQGDQALFGKAYPYPPAEPVAAAGRKFLEAWSKQDFAGMRTLTHPGAPAFAPTVDAFRKNWETHIPARLPEGAAPELTLDARFSRWDLGLLFTYPRNLAELRAGTPPQARSTKEFPFPEIQAGSVAVLRYNAEGKEYLMLLVRRQGKWEVLEPALKA